MFTVTEYAALKAILLFDYVDQENNYTTNMLNYLNISSNCFRKKLSVFFFTPNGMAAQLPPLLVLTSIFTMIRAEYMICSDFSRYTFGDTNGVRPSTFVCLFDLILYVPVNNLSNTSGRVFLG